MQKFKEADIYCDGSYDPRSNRYSWGLVILLSDGVHARIARTDNVGAFAKSRNVAGEIFGAIEAMEWARSHKCERLRLYHDFDCIGGWADGSQNSENRVAKLYIERCAVYKEAIAIDFIKVKGHSHVKYHDMAHRLAKDALKVFRRNRSARPEPAAG